MLTTARNVRLQRKRLEYARRKGSYNPYCFDVRDYDDNNEDDFPSLLDDNNKDDEPALMNVLRDKYILSSFKYQISYF